VKRGPTGTYETVTTAGGEPVRAFVPRPLPPDPPLDWSGPLRDQSDQVLLNLGRLDSVSALLPDVGLFLYMYVRKEAVLSSQIEGTRSSISDLLLFEIDEAPGVPIDDVQEVSNYVAALNHGLDRLRSDFPLSNRLLREIHAILLANGRGFDRTPGEFRRSQNWVGGTRPGNAVYVPPPAERVPELMGELEKFLHDQSDPAPVLLKAALSHVQFESIHPFLDGNGRLGRLLITFLLCAQGVLREPLLYLSLYFKQHREEYYDALQRVRTEGAWEGWLSFFLEGVQQTAEQAVEAARRLAEMFREDRERIQGLGRRAGSSLRVHEALQRHPILTIARTAEATGLSIPTVTASLKALESADVGVVRELTGRRRNRLFGYDRYLQILSEGTEPEG